jgi:putative copper export protein
VLSPSLDTVRIFIHVLAASIWVGGQLVLAGVVPTVHRQAPDALKGVAQAFARVAWPAFGIAVLTGMWNLVEVDLADTSSDYQVTVMVKIVVVAVSGGAAFAHQVGSSKAAKAIGGAFGLLAGLAAMFLGVLLAG